MWSAGSQSQPHEWLGHTSDRAANVAPEVENALRQGIRAHNSFSAMFVSFGQNAKRGYGATAARLAPDQKVGSSNHSALICRDLHVLIRLEVALRAAGSSRVDRMPKGGTAQQQHGSSNSSALILPKYSCLGSVEGRLARGKSAGANRDAPQKQHKRTAHLSTPWGAQAVRTAVSGLHLGPPYR